MVHHVDKVVKVFANNKLCPTVHTGVEDFKFHTWVCFRSLSLSPSLSVCDSDELGLMTTGMWFVVVSSDNIIKDSE